MLSNEKLKINNERNTFDNFVSIYKLQLNEGYIFSAKQFEI